MKISVIVPAFNEEKLLGASLAEINAAAAAFAARGWEYELVVCDNNSTDRTAAIARDAGAKVIFEPINQIARARNAGASIATGDWLVFVDADSHPSVELFADVAEQVSAGKVLAGGVTIRLDEKLFVAGLITQLPLTLIVLPALLTFLRDRKTSTRASPGDQLWEVREEF